MTSIDLALAAVFLLIAIAYSSVGHAGASGYIAAMSLIGLAPSVIRPTALALNVLVAGIGVWRFHRADLIDWLAAELGCPKRAVELLRGQAARRKQLKIDVPVADVSAWLARVLG